MLPKDELELLRRNIQAVAKQTADILERLDRLEQQDADAGATDMQQPALSVSPESSLTAGLNATAIQSEQMSDDIVCSPQLLWEAVSKGDVALTKQCIASGVDVNGITAGKSLLDQAIADGRFEMVQLLVNNGACIEHNPDVGKSHIRTARLLGFDAIALFLRQHLHQTSTPPDLQSVTSHPASASTLPLQDMTPAWSEQIVNAIASHIAHRFDTLRRQTSELGWEVQLGTYFLPRIAVVCIAIAVVFFLSLAMERWGSQWMPHVRVSVGYVVALGLLLLARRSESLYQGLARVAYGGGFAVMYFVTFATHYVPFARIFSSPAPTLTALALIVSAWAITAQIRKSKIIALLVTVLGHLTIMLATLAPNHPGVLAMAGIILLSMGSAFFLLRNRWYYVASLGMIGSYANYFLALAHGHPGNPHTDCIGSMGIATVFFLIYALSELFAPRDLRRQAVPGWFRNAFVAFNTGAWLVLCTIVMSNYEFTRGHQDLFRFAAAIALMTIGLGYLRLQAGDPLFNVYFVKSISILTLGLATRYGGDTLSVCFAIEMIVLLLSARRSGLVVMRLLAWGAAGLAFSQALDTLPGLNFVHKPGIWTEYWTAGYGRHIFPPFFSITAFLLASQICQRTRWNMRSPKSIAGPQFLVNWFWRLDLITERPASLAYTFKPCNGLLIPHLYAFAGAVVYFTYLFPLVTGGHQFPAMSIFALLLSILAAAFHSQPFGLAAVLAFAASTGAFGVKESILTTPFRIEAFLMGLVASCAIALMSESKFIGRPVGLRFHQKNGAPYCLYGACSVLTGLMLIRQFPGINGLFALMTASVVSAGLMLVLHTAAFSLIAGGFLLCACLLFMNETRACLLHDPFKCGMAAWLLFGVSLLTDRYFDLSKRRASIGVYLGNGLVLVAGIALMHYLDACMAPEKQIVATVLVCFGLLAYAKVFRSYAAALTAVGGTLFASLIFVDIAHHATSLPPSLITAFIPVALFWILCERIAARILLRFDLVRRWMKNNIGGALKGPEIVIAPIGLTTFLTAHFLYRIPYLGGYNPAFITIGWFILAAGLFIIALAVHQRFYRYAGLIIIVLSLARLFFIDMKEQDPLLRVAAFAIAGSGLLCISIGYFKWMRSRKEEEDSQ